MQQKDPGKIYHIILLGGIHFPKLQNTPQKFQNIFQSISKTFCLISYLSNVCQVKVTQRYSTGILRFQFNCLKSGRVSGWLSKEQTSPHQFKFSIDFQYKQNKTGIIWVKLENRIQKEQKILIQINDESNILHQQFKHNVDSIQSIRLSPQLLQSENQLTYFYKQPPIKSLLSTHYFLAFDWGGIQAVGFGKVVNIIESMKKRNSQGKKISEGIKSIIGSEMGGLVGLQIICESYMINRQIERKNPDKFVETILKTIKEVLEDNGSEQQNKEKKNDSQEHNDLVKGLLESIGLSKNQDFINFIQREENHEVLKDSLFQLFWEYHQAFSKMERPQDSQRKNFYIDSSFKKSKSFRQYSEAVLVDTFKTRNMTLAALYQRTQIQYTLTALDLTNKIVRFFNHKTTPELPVAVAIQISSTSFFSFPRMIWKKQWGKYYIHYDIIRKQVDLEGCEFVTGGHLVTYPINYLDNNEILPRYFAHSPNDNTYMMGFTLNRIHKEYKHQQKKKQEHLLKNIKKICGLFQKFCSQTITNQQFTGQSIEIILNKILMIPETLISAVHNLNLEYFHENANIIPYSLPQYKGKSILDSQTKNDVLEFVLEQFQKIDCIDNSDNPIRILKANLEYVQKLQFNIKSEKNILKFMNLLKIIYLPLYFESPQQISDLFRGKNIEIYNQLSKKSKNCPKRENYIQIFENIKKDHLFWICETQQDIIKLQNTFSLLKLFLEQNTHEINDIIRKIHGQQDKQFEKMRDHLLDICEYKYNQEEKKLNYYYYDFSRRIRNFQKLFYCTNYRNIEAFIQNISYYFGERVHIYQNFMEEETIIRNFYSEIFLRKNLFLPLKSKYETEHSKYKNLSIHVVLQSSHQSYKHVIPYLSIIEQSLLEHIGRQEMVDCSQGQNSKMVIVPKIETITASGFNCIPVLLYASKLKRQLIEEKIFDLTKNLKKAEWIESCQKFEWLMQNKNYNGNEKITLNRLRNFLTETLQDTEQQIKNRSSSLSAEKLINKINEKKQIMVTQLQFLFDQLTNSLDSHSGEAIGHQIEDHYQTIQQFVQIFGYRPIYNLLNSSAYALQYFKSLVAEVDKFKDEKCENSRIIKALAGYYMLLTYKIRDYLGQILDLLQLDHNITLEEFSKCSKQDLSINFTIFQYNLGHLMFVNKQTRPKMPLWAAVLAAISLPILFPAVKDSVHWMNFENENLASSQARLKLFNKQFDQQKQFYSGDFLNKLPLTLLCNNKIKKKNLSKKKVTKSSEQVIICMSLSQNSSKLKSNLKSTEEAKEKLKKIISTVKQSNSADSIIWNILHFFRKIINPNYHMLKDVYDSETCQIDAMHPSLIFQHEQYNWNQIQNTINFYLDKGKFISQVHLINHPPKKIYFTLKMYPRKDKNLIEIAGPLVNPSFIIENIIQLTNQSITIDKGHFVENFIGQGSPLFKGKKNNTSNADYGKISYKMESKDDYKTLSPGIQLEVDKDITKCFFKLKYQPKQEHSSQNNVRIRYFHNIRFISSGELKQQCYEFNILCNHHKSVHEVQSFKNLKIQFQSISQRQLGCSLIKRKENTAQLQILQEMDYSEYADIENKIKITKQQPQPQQINLSNHHLLRTILEFNQSKHKQKVFINFVKKVYDDQQVSYDQYSITHQIELDKIKEIFLTKGYIFFYFPYNVLYHEKLLLTSKGEQFGTITKILDKKRDKTQSYLMCPKCFGHKGSLQLLKQENQIGQCYFCKNQKRLLLSCRNCEQGIGILCAECIYTFKDDDSNVYTCTYCNSDITAALKVDDSNISVRKCWKCLVIDNGYFHDENCGYSFCQKCFKNISRFQRQT